MSTRLFPTVLAAFSLIPSAFAATHSEVTPYSALHSQLALQPGQTYLSFMEREVKPALDSYEQDIQNDPANRSHNYSQLQSDLIAKGEGVAIRIDSRNYIFNIGYLNGSDAQNDIKSGRSYGVGPAGTESDPSDLAYLKELESYLKSEPKAAGDFIEALMKVITDCDPSGWSKLSPAGQAVATDFLAIYTAELDRHLMVKLNPRQHPWETDLAAATFVAVFDTSSGLVMQNGALVQGGLSLWWAKGQQGSGIGETRRDRQALQHLIAREEADSAEARELLSLIGNRSDGDVIQGVLEYLNSDAAPKSMSGAQAEKLSGTVSSFLKNVQAHSSQIASLR